MEELKFDGAFEADRCRFLVAFEDLQSEKRKGIADIFARVDENGDFIYDGKKLVNTRSFASTTIPAREIRRLESALAIFHEWALDRSTRGDMRDFYRNFKIPVPTELPEAYRIVGKFRKRLVVCWGYGSEDKYVLPMTYRAKVAAKAAEVDWVCSKRKSVAGLFRDWRTMFRNILWTLFFATISAYFIIGVPVHCNHGEVVGHGIGGRFFVRKCPKVCIRCGLHLDADLSCPKCRCKICGAKRELTQEGICAHPPQEETCSATVGSENAHRCGRHCKPAKQGAESRCNACLSTEL